MSTIPLFPTLGVPELVIILVLVLILFGAGKLPEVAGALGKSIKTFRDAQSNLEEKEEPQIEVEPIDEAEERDETRSTKSVG